jgi:hypothetical protein
VTKHVVANLLVLVGLGAVTVGGWLVHPAAGLVLAGVAAVSVGVGIVRDTE